MKGKILLLGLSLSLVAAACNQTANTPSPAASNNNSADSQSQSQVQVQVGQSAPMLVPLTALNGSKQDGTAVLTDLGNGKTQVKIELNNAPASSEPAHIHAGACPNPGAIAYDLTDVVAGHSTSVIDTTMDNLMKQLPLAINIHKSAAEIITDLSCGDIK